jgi:DNA-binding transcriptional LysR family regulator
MDGVIAPMIARFQQAHPDVRVDQSWGYVDEFAERLRGGTRDMAILPLQRDRVPKGPSFQAILPGLTVIACRTGHPLARRRLITPTDIAQFPRIAPPVESPLYRDLRRALANIGASEVRISVSGGSLASVLSVLKGQNRVTALSLEIGHPDRDLGILAMNATLENAAARRFRSFVVLQFESLSRRIMHHQKDQL